MNVIQQNIGVVFDMDGVLIDTEPLWGVSMMTIAQKYEIPLTYEDLRFTQGLRIQEVTAFWAERFPWKSKVSSDEIAEEILDHIIENAKQNACVLPGIIAHLNYLKEHKVPLAVATSSPNRMMNELLSFFKIDHFFDQMCSAEDCVLGKPHPEVYIAACNAIGVLPFNCIAIEDSINGMVAAKAAKMKVVVVPEKNKITHSAWGLADSLVASMDAFEKGQWFSL